MVVGSVCIFRIFTETNIIYETYIDGDCHGFCNDGIGCGYGAAGKESGDRGYTAGYG